MGLVSDTFTIISSKQKDVVVGILKINGDTTSDAERTGDMGKPFCGEVNDNSFKIQRVIWYRNSFLPVITGTITAKGEGSVVEVKMSQRKFVIGFEIFWMVAVCIVLFSHMTFTRDDLLPVVMLVFGAVLFTVPYKIEANIARKKLEELLR